MAVFKVGQRVRIKWVSGGNSEKRGARAGMTATIMLIPGATTGDCDLSVDGLPDHVPGAIWPYWAAKFAQLEPLVPPTEDADFQAFMRKTLEPLENLQPLSRDTEKVVVRK